MYRRKRRNLSSSVQFENENDITPSVINMSLRRFPVLFTSVLEYNINLPKEESCIPLTFSSMTLLGMIVT